MADDETPTQHNDGGAAAGQGASASPVADERQRNPESASTTAPAADSTDAIDRSGGAGGSTGPAEPGTGSGNGQSAGEKDQPGGTNGQHPDPTGPSGSDGESAAAAEPSARSAATPTGAAQSGAAQSGAAPSGTADQASPWARPGQASAPSTGVGATDPTNPTSSATAPPSPSPHDAPVVAAPGQTGSNPSGQPGYSGLPSYPGAAQQPTYQYPTVQYPQPDSAYQPASAPSGRAQPGPAQPGPAQPGAGATAPNPDRDKHRLWVAALVLVLVGALLGGAIGGIFGYRFAANGGHLGAVSAAQAQAATEEVSNKVLPSVVQLRVKNEQQSGAGSGMILSPDGLILTNNHVIDPVTESGTLQILFQDGRAAAGKVVAHDSGSDLALVQAQHVSGLEPIELGDSDPVSVGQTVIAFGSPLGLGGTVTTGVVSSLNRAVEVSPDEDEKPQPPQLSLPDLPPGLNPLFPRNSPSPQTSQPGAAPPEVLDAIQTDAAINPGNSGGPLVDLDGKVIGINTAIASLSSGSDQSGSVGLGFSIPINQAKRIVQQLRTTGKATKALLGVTVAGGSRLSPPGDPVGALVAGVTPGGAADKAGIKKDDVIVRVNQRPITYSDELVASIRAQVPNSTITLTLANGRSVEVHLGEGPS
jgi:putative serine protease PepD